MSNQELAKNIIALLGGKENITNAENCMTRMRVNVKDDAKVNDQALKDLDGVLGLVHKEANYVQVILGPGKVRDIMAICTEEFGISEVKESKIGEWEKNKAEVKSQQKKSGFKDKIHVIADIFTPMIPAFVASGICNGLGKLVSILIKNGTLPDVLFTALLMNFLVLIGKAFLGYLAIFTGVRAAKQFGVNEMLGGMIGAASLHATVNKISALLGWFDAEVANNSVLAAGAGGIVGVVIGVWILAKVERWIHKHMPEVLDVAFTPLLAMLVTVPLYVLIVMPITGYISTLISALLNFLLGSSNPVVSVLTGYVLAATFLPLVLLGLHRGLVPIYALQIGATGSTSLFPVVAMAGAGQVGAAIALYIKAKRVGNKRMKQVILGAIPAGVLGIGEPLIYGVTLPMVKPFITAGLGAGFGGAWCVLTATMSTAFSPSGLLGVTHMLPECMLNYLIGVLISYVAGAVITYFAISDKDVERA